MQVGAALLLIVLLLTSAFAALNWSVFTAPVALSFGLGSVDAPLGLLLLGVIALVSLLFLSSGIALQGRALAETRRQARELKAQRELADQAEASRFTELRDFVSAELLRVAQTSSNTRDGILARLERMETQQRLLIEQTGNTLSSYIGQLEDRLDREHRMPPIERSGGRDVPAQR